MRLIIIIPVLLLSIASLYAQAPADHSDSLTLWLKANADVFTDAGVTPATNGQNIQEWHDQSGSANNILNVTLANQPIYRAGYINYNPTVQFETNDFLEDLTMPGSNLFDPTQNTVFMVVKYFSGAVIFKWESSSINRLGFEGYLGDSIRMDFPSDNGPNQALSNQTIIDRYRLIAGITSGVTDSLLLEGQLTGTSNSGTLNTGVTGIFTLGADPSGVNPSACEIAEVIVFKDQLTPLERQKVHTYLAIKYGLTIDQTVATDYIAPDGTVILEATAATHDAYDKDIAGIGRDDSQELLQPRSNSINLNSAIVTMENPSSLDDHDYLVWGHDGWDKDITQITDVPIGFTHRMRRLWRVDETGEVGTVDIKVYVGNLSGRSNNAADFALVHGASPVMSGQPATVASSLSNDTLTFTGISFNDHDYFTIAYTASLPGGAGDGLRLWLRADNDVYNDGGTTPATNGQTVQEWHDKSGFGNDVIQTNAPDKPTFATQKINYNPTLTFSDNILQDADGVFENGVTYDDISIYVIYNDDDQSDFDWLLYEGNDITDRMSISNNFSGGTDTDLDIANDRILFNNNTQTSPGKPYLLAWNNGINPIYGTGPTRQSVLINNNELDADNTFSSYTGTGQPFQLGDNEVGVDNLNNPFSGDIAEVLIYTQEIDASLRLRIESYLAWKYGITKAFDYESSIGIRMWDATDKAAHHNDVVGIGRDDISGLTQTKSFTINDTVGVLMENPTNLDDQEFLFWGHNGVSIDSITSANVPPGFDYRLGRDWQVDEFGSLGNITSVKFVLPNLPGTSVVASDYALVRHNNSSFEFGTITTASSISGDTIIINNVDFNDNEFFTLVFSGELPGGVPLNLKSWYKANGNVNTTGTVVNSWNNELINRPDITNVIGNPTLEQEVLNFNPVVRFDGDDGLFESGVVCSELFDTTDNSIFVVYNLSAGNILTKWEDNIDATNNRFSMEGLATSLRFDHPTSLAANQALSATNGYGSYFIATGLSSSTTDSLFLQGRLDATSTGGANDLTGLGTLMFGANSTGTFASQSDIAEVIIYGRHLPLVEKQKVESYLAIKYGITLDQSTATNYLGTDGTVIYAATSTHDAYDNNIAGLGRDDSEGLLQNKSRSINPGAMIQMENPANLDDQEYLIWGHDGTPATAVQTTDPAGGWSARMTRLWRVDETGNLSSVTVRVYVGNLPGAPTNPSDFAFTHGLSPTVATHATFTGVSISNDTVVFNGVDFQDGDYFTIAYNASPSLGNIIPREDYFTVLENSTSVKIDVAFNDVDNYNGIDRSTITIIGVPTGGGTAVPDGNGNIDYTPLGGYTGNDTVYYRVCSNSGGLCDTTYLVVEVEPLNPLAICFDYRKKLSVDTSLVAGNTDMASFPVLVAITDPDLRTTANGGQVQSPQGYDIVFSTDSLGTHMLNHELEFYDPASGQFIAWVRLPVLRYNQQVNFWMWYGNGTSIVDPSSTEVWKNKYEAVWHMSDTADALNNYGMVDNATSDVSGQVNRGRDFNGTTSYLDVGDSIAIAQNKNALTISTWAFVRDFSTEKSLIELSIESGPQTGTSRAKLSVLPTGAVHIKGQTVSGGPAPTNNTISVINTGQWYHITGIYDYTDDTLIIYVDGALEAMDGGNMVSFSNPNTDNTPGRNNKIGVEDDVSGKFLDGILDEVRVASVPRSPAWIATEFNTENVPGTFISLGIQETLTIIEDSVKDVSCFGGNDGAIYISVSGGVQPYNFSWSSGGSVEDDINLTAEGDTLTLTDALGCVRMDTFVVAEPSALALALDSIVDVSCNGGSDGEIWVTASGGTGPYTYSWTSGPTTDDVTGLAAGGDTITVTDDNGCTLLDTFEVTEPATPVTIGLDSIVDVSCFGAGDGAIYITASGGIGSYTYSWTSGPTTDDITGLSGGGDTITVTDAQGCVGVDTFIVNEPGSTISIALDSILDVTCNGASDGEVYITVSGGTMPYSYAWNNGSTSDDPTGLAAGLDTVVVTDLQGCSIQDTFRINEPNALLITSTDTPPTCNGGSDGAIDITVTGGTAPYSYLWNTTATTEDITGLAAATYNVTVTDTNGCAEPYNTTLTDPLAITITGTVTDVSQPGLMDGAIDISVANGTSPYSYVWNTGDTTQDISGIAAGTDTVTVTDANTCSAMAVFVVTELPSTFFQIYQTLSPNNDGYNDTWVIDGIENYPDNEVLIFDRWGNLVYQAKGYDNTGTLWEGKSNTGFVPAGKYLPVGTYFYKVNLGNDEEPLSGFVVINK